MNVHKSKIEWCSHTWNPVTGCRHAWPAGHVLQGHYAAVHCAAVRGGTK
jgi:protein gp37